MAAVGTIRLHRPDPAAADELQRCGRATFAVHQPSPSRVSVAVHGDVDAVNARDLGRYVERHTRVSKQLVVDLRAVDFFGSQAFTALYYISVRCARGDVDWMIIGSPPVRRLLSICDPRGELPLVDDLPCALERLDRLAQCHHIAPGGLPPVRPHADRIEMPCAVGVYVPATPEASPGMTPPMAT